MYRIAALTLASLTLVACATPQETKCDAAAPVETTAPSAPNTLPPELLAAAQNASAAKQIRVYFGEDGVRKMAVYHTDAESVPAAVLETAKGSFPSATITEYEVESYEDIGLVYEVEMTTPDGREVEVAVLPDGTLHYSEAPMAIEALPENVRAAVDSILPGATILEAEVKRGPTLDLVQVKLDAGDSAAKHYLVFDAKGELVRHTLRYPAFVEVPVAK